MEPGLALPWGRGGVCAARTGDFRLHLTFPDRLLCKEDLDPSRVSGHQPRASSKPKGNPAGPTAGDQARGGQLISKPVPQCVGSGNGCWLEALISQKQVVALLPSWCAKVGEAEARPMGRNWAPVQAGPGHSPAHWSGLG